MLPRIWYHYDGGDSEYVWLARAQIVQITYKLLQLVDILSSDFDVASTCSARGCAGHILLARPLEGHAKK
jgi:hypothetical protein